jgi:hypothetical protein
MDGVRSTRWFKRNCRSQLWRPSRWGVLGSCELTGRAADVIRARADVLCKAASRVGAGREIKGMRPKQPLTPEQITLAESMVLTSTAPPSRSTSRPGSPRGGSRGTHELFDGRHAYAEEKRRRPAPRPPARQGYLGVLLVASHALQARPPPEALFRRTARKSTGR